MVSVFKENKGAYCCLSVESQTFQNHVHFICNSHITTMRAPHWPWQHAGLQQNGQEQLATDENQV